MAQPWVAQREGDDVKYAVTRFRERWIGVPGPWSAKSLTGDFWISPRSRSHGQVKPLGLRNAPRMTPERAFGAGL